MKIWHFSLLSTIRPWTENLPSAFSMIHVVARWSMIIININNTSSSSSHVSSSWYLLRWSTTSHCDQSFKITITAGVRGPSRVCDEQRELSWNSGNFFQNSGNFSRNSGTFLGIPVKLQFLVFGWDFLLGRKIGCKNAKRNGQLVCSVRKLWLIDKRSRRRYDVYQPP